MPNSSAHPFLRVFRRMAVKDRRRFIRWLADGFYAKRKGLEVPAGLAYDALNKARPLPAAVTSLQLTYLRGELETFLAIDSFVVNEAARTRQTILALENLKELKRAQKIRDKRVDLISDTTLRDEYLELQLLYHDLTQRGTTFDLETSLALFRKSDLALDRYYLMVKLQQACHLETHNSIYKVAERLPMLDAVLAAIEQNPAWLDDSLIALNYYAYRVLSTHNTADGEKLHELLSRQKKVMHSPALRMLYMMLLNFFVRQENMGNASYERLLFNMYKLGLESGVLFQNGLLSGSTFLNMASRAIKSGETTWLDDFLENNRRRLSETDQQTFYPYCMANYHYEAGNLNEAHRSLMRFDYSISSTPLQVLARTTQTKVFFDAGDIDLLDSHLNSFATFLSRHKELGYQREILLSFVRLCKQLIQLPPRITPKKHEKLTSDFTALPVASLRNWLLERLPK